MSKFSISDLDLYYDKGAFHALKKHKSGNSGK